MRIAPNRRKLRLLLSIAVLFSICNACSPSPVEPPRLIRDSIVAIATGQSTAYLILQNNQAALLDSGSEPSASQIANVLSEKGLNRFSVRAIFATSPHQKHNAGAGNFTQAQTFVGKGDQRVLMADKPPRAFWPKLKARLSPRAGAPLHTVPIFSGDHLWPHGFKVNVVGVPGYSRDSMMFIYQGILFTGGALQIENGEFSIPSQFESADRSLLKTALQRLLKVKFDTVADGQGHVEKFEPIRFAAFLDSLH